MTDLLASCSGSLMSLGVAGAEALVDALGFSLVLNLTICQSCDLLQKLLWMLSLAFLGIDIFVVDISNTCDRSGGWIGGGTFCGGLMVFLLLVVLY